MTTDRIKCFFCLFILEGFLFSCFPVPRSYKKTMGCYSEKYTGLDTLINVHGIYTKMSIEDKTGITGVKNGKWVQLGIDTSYSTFFFMSNGIFIANLRVSNPISTSIDRAIINGRKISGALEGVYEVSGDTIKVKYINTGGYSNNVWSGNEVWYKVLDKNTIVDFYIKPLVVSVGDKNKQEFKAFSYTNATPAKFQYLKAMPDFYIWLQEQKWFSCK